MLSTIQNLLVQITFSENKYKAESSLLNENEIYRKKRRWTEKKSFKKENKKKKESKARLV